MSTEYRMESIGNNIQVCVSDAHTFGTDSFLLADFARPKAKDTACDLGTGCGIIPLLWLRENVPATVHGIDIQPQAIYQAKESARASHQTHRFFPLEGDIKSMRTLLPAGSMTLVTSNPPYSVEGSGVQSPTDSRLIARHETLCTMDDIAAGAAWLLRTGGRFCLCQLPERLPDVMVSLRKHRMEPKRLRLVHQTAEQAPWLVLVEGRREGKPSLVIEPPLVLRNADGSPTEEIRRIYHEYGKV